MARKGLAYRPLPPPDSYGSAATCGKSRTAKGFHSGIRSPGV